MKQKFNIKGMTCSACQAHVEHAVNKLDGIKQCSVNLLSNSMQVEYDETKLNSDLICDAVASSGYQANIASNTKDENQKSQLFNHLIVSLLFLLPLMILSMGHMVGIVFPFFSQKENVVYFILLQFILTVPLMIIHRGYFGRGFKSLFKRSPNMDSLIAIGSASAFIYGCYALIVVIVFSIRQDFDSAYHYQHNLYFESAVMILTLVTLGKFLEEKSKRKTTEAVDKIIHLAPDTVFVLNEHDEEVKTLINDVKINDLLVLRPGDRIAVDGVIIQGSTSIDESAITGEAIPVYKEIGSDVVSGGINLASKVVYQAKAVGNDTTLAKLANLVMEAANSKAPISKLADKVSYYFVPTVILISLIMFVVWAIVKNDFDFAFNIAISILVISCPCALGLATPVAIMVSTGKAAEANMLVKSAESLEIAHKLDYVVLDKTGTITLGHPIVTAFDKKNDDALAIAYSMESESNHPLAQAIVNFAKDNKAEKLELTSLELGGKGLIADYNGEKYYLGSPKLINEYCEEQFLEEILGTIVILATKNKILGIFKIEDQIKKSSIIAINLLQKLHIKVAMLTGDNQASAKLVNDRCQVDEVISDVLPEDKQKYIKKYQDQGFKVAMVGDGINDSAALAQADVGIAIGSGTDIALESADIILASSDLIDVYNVIRLSNKTIKNIKLSLFWAFFYNTLGIPIAAGLLYPFFGITLSPMIGSLCMSLSSVCVVLNALRLRLFKNEEIKEMQTVIKVDGMMCQNCVKHVKTAVLKVAGVTGVEVDLKKKKVEIEGNAINQDEIFQAIIDAGYNPSEYKGK